MRAVPETAPAVLNGTPLLPLSGQREFAAGFKEPAA